MSALLDIFVCTRRLTLENSSDTWPQVGATQGNTEADMKKWGERVYVSAWDATQDTTPLAAALRVPVQVRGVRR